MKLSKDEKKFLAALRNRGHMSKAEAMAFWSTPHYTNSKIKRLYLLKLILLTENEMILPNKKLEENLYEYLG